MCRRGVSSRFPGRPREARLDLGVEIDALRMNLESSGIIQITILNSRGIVLCSAYSRRAFVGRERAQEGPTGGHFLRLR